MSVRYFGIEEIVYLHRHLMLEEGQSPALLSLEKLESAVLRPSAEAFGEEFYPTLAEKAAALLQGIVIAHPFMDGNKRIGLGAMLAFLRLNSVPPVAEEGPLYEFVIAVTTGELREVEDIAAELRVLFAPHLA